MQPRCNQTQKNSPFPPAYGGRETRAPASRIGGAFAIDHAAWPRWPTGAVAVEHVERGRARPGWTNEQPQAGLRSLRTGRLGRRGPSRPAPTFSTTARACLRTGHASKAVTAGQQASERPTPASVTGRSAVAIQQGVRDAPLGDEGTRLLRWAVARRVDWVRGDATRRCTLPARPALAAVFDPPLPLGGVHENGELSRKRLPFSQKVAIFAVPRGRFGSPWPAWNRSRPRRRLGPADPSTHRPAAMLPAVC